MYIELLLANSVVALFFIFLAIFVEKHGYIKQHSSGFKAFKVVTYLMFNTLMLSIMFALFLGFLLPPVFPKTFIYKAFFVLIALWLIWSWQMYRAQNKRQTS